MFLFILFVLGYLVPALIVLMEMVAICYDHEEPTGFPEVLGLGIFVVVPIVNIYAALMVVWYRFSPKQDKEEG